MIYPPRLRTGDAVGIVAPARKISPGQLEPALELLRSWGLKPLLARNLFSAAHSYLAGTDAERRNDLQDMIDNPSVKAIFSARGGYGSTRIIEDINFSALKRAPKWIIGFSDITAFHLKLAVMNIASIHGTMPIFFGRPQAAVSVESLRNILFDGNCSIEWLPHDQNRPGQAKGITVGGNLSLIADALNTSSEPDTRNKILVIEEIDEYFYKLDRMLTQLRRSGKLKEMAALVIGHMTDIKNSELDFGETVFHIVSHAVRDYRFPVAFSFPSGHQEPNLAWVHGGEAVLNVGINKVSLAYPALYPTGT